MVIGFGPETPQKVVDNIANDTTKNNTDKQHKVSDYLQKMNEKTIDKVSGSS